MFVERAEGASRSLESLEDELSELAGQINAAMCRWLRLVAEYDEREGWKEWGCGSCAHWLSLRCGTAPGAAREHVRVARRLEALPRVLAAFEDGRLSYSKVRAVSRVATEHNEEDLLELALQATAAQLERIVRAYRGVLSLDEAREEAVRSARYVSWYWDENGSLAFRGRLPAEEGALLLRALEAARDATPEEPEEDVLDVSAETPHDRVAAETQGTPKGRSNADALVAVAEGSLASQEVARSGGDRYQVVVHADVAALSGSAEGGRCELGDGGRLNPEVARRLACDASVVRLIERDGKPLSAGRKTRTIAPSLRRALQSRDRGCRFPGCTQHRFVDAHHIDHWAHGGRTDMGNLVLLCRRHHRLLHEGGFGVRRRRGGALEFRRPDGRVIKPGPGPEPCGGRPPRPLAREGIGPETPVALSAGARFSLEMAVDGLLTADARPRSGTDPPG